MHKACGMAFLIAIAGILLVRAQSQPSPNTGAPTPDSRPARALLVVAVFSAIAATGSCFAAYLNLRTTHQLKRGETFLNIADILDDPEHRMARRKTRQRLRPWQQAADDDLNSRSAAVCCCRSAELCWRPRRQQMRQPPPNPRSGIALVARAQCG